MRETASPSPSARRTLVIDTDPGIDDAIALALAAPSPALDLRLVTTVVGNVPLAQSTNNALKVLGFLGRADVAVAAGADRGLVRVKPEHRAIHGMDGLGGVEFPPAGRPVSRRHAVDAMAELLRAEPPGSVTVVAIAPLTNLGLLLAMHPDAATRIREVVMMGGSAGTGNVTPAAEYNCWADPEAAQRVLSSGLTIRIAQLEVTRQARVDGALRRRMASASRLGATLQSMIDGYEDEVGVIPALHDVVPVAAVIDPTLMPTEPAAVSVVTDTGAERGRTVVDFQSGGAETGIEVAVGLDTARLCDLLMAAISD